MQNLEKINLHDDFLLNGSMNKQAVKMIGFESLVLYLIFVVLNEYYFIFVNYFNLIKQAYTRNNHSRN
ncbi:hypothetical protein MASR2M39_30800 [Ignavibacteriales bacterium]